MPRTCQRPEGMCMQTTRVELLQGTTTDVEIAASADNVHLRPRVRARQVQAETARSFFVEIRKAGRREQAAVAVGVLY